MTAMPQNTDPERFDLLEMDNYRSTRTEEAQPDDSAARFDLLEFDRPDAPNPVTPSEPTTVLQEDIVPEFDNDFGSTPEELSSIVAESSVNAAAPGSGAFGTVRRVTAENAVTGVTNDGQMSTDSGATLGIFARPAAERQFIVGPNAQQVQDEALRPGKLESGQVIAGAVAEGHGVLVGWRGDRQITRAVLLEALRGIGRDEWAPKPKDARAQAGRAMAAVGSGYHIKADKKTGAITASEGANTGRHTWRLGHIDSMGQPGDAYGRNVAVMTLSPDGVLSGAGDMAVINTIRDDYAARCASELYTSADLTQWLAGQLMGKCGAINYAVGWYIPARHKDAAIALCNAVSTTGWGSDWLGSKERPALPIATCDELRDGLARGLKDEVAQVLAKLHTEREAAKAAKERAIADAKDAGAKLADPKEGLAALDSAHKLAGDIGPKRATTFLRDLKAIATRVIAYGELLGDERMGSARRAVHEAVCELEGLLDSDNSGISQRFGLIFEELAEEAKRNGAVL